jgi:hypothetical protein
LFLVRGGVGRIFWVEGGFGRMRFWFRGGRSWIRRHMGLSKALWSLGYCLYEQGLTGTYGWRCAVFKVRSCCSIGFREIMHKICQRASNVQRYRTSGLESPALKFSKRLFKRSQATHSYPASLLLNPIAFIRLATMLSFISFMLIR